MKKNPCWLIAVAAAMAAALHAAPPLAPGAGCGSASCVAEMIPNPAIEKAMAGLIAATAVMMVQRANIGNGDASEIRRAFQETAAQP